MLQLNFTPTSVGTVFHTKWGQSFNAPVLTQSQKALQSIFRNHGEPVRWGGHEGHEGHGHFLAIFPPMQRKTAWDFFFGGGVAVDVNFSRTLITGPSRVSCPLLQSLWRKDEDIAGGGGGNPTEDCSPTFWQCQHHWHRCLAVLVGCLLWRDKVHGKGCFLVHLLK